MLAHLLIGGRCPRGISSTTAPNISPPRVGRALDRLPQPRTPMRCEHPNGICSANFKPRRSGIRTHSTRQTRSKEFPGKSYRHMSAGMAVAQRHSTTMISLKQLPLCALPRTTAPLPIRRRWVASVLSPRRTWLSTSKRRAAPFKRFPQAV